MDNFFDYLFLLFIAYAIVSSYLKQLKKNSESSGSKRMPPLPKEDVETNQSSSAEQDLGALTDGNASPAKLSDIDKSFNLDYDMNIQPDYQTDYDVKYQSDYNANYVPATKQNWVEEKIKKQMEMDAIKDEKYLSNERPYFQKESEVNLANSLKNKLNNPKNFKEAFLFSELINPPISLRDDG